MSKEDCRHLNVKWTEKNEFYIDWHCNDCGKDWGEVLSNLEKESI